MLLQALYQWTITALSANEIDAQFHAESDMESVDVEYFQSVLRYITSHAEQLDALVVDLLDRPAKELDPVSLSILRIGAYEFSERLEIPYKVVINEGINLARKFGPAESSKFINAVLDRLAVKLRPVEVKGTD